MNAERVKLDNQRENNWLLMIFKYLKTKTNKKLLWLILSLFFVWICFNKAVEKLYSDYIVINVLSYFEPSWITELGIYILTLIFGLITYRRTKRNYQISFDYFLISLCVSIIYLKVRVSGTYSFYNLKLLTSFYYFDYIFLFMIYASIILFMNVKINITKKEREAEGFMADEPITNIKEDFYKRNSYAAILANEINNTHVEKSLAIGINGAWGIGKTSFINLLKYQLNKDIIFIDFNPWNSISKENVIMNFFDILEKNLKIYSPKLSKELAKYSNLLANITDGQFSKVLKEITSLFSEQSVSQTYEEVNSIIKEINKKIIIFIDDIDRLQKDEIIQIVKLIRNTANFYNTIFIVTYDRTYINKAFKELSEENSSLYLEKIFQIELDLPHIDPYLIRISLINSLKPKINNKYHQNIDRLLSPASAKDYPFLDYYLKTMRDVTRFVNLFSFQFAQIEDEVDFLDYFNLFLIKAKYPEIIRHIFDQKDKYFKINEDQSKYVIIFDKNDTNTIISQDKNDIADKLNIPRDMVTIIEKSILAIWGYSTKDSQSNEKKAGLLKGILITRNKSNKSIIYRNTFYRYFTNTIFTNDISERKWEETLKLKYNEIITEMKSWIDKGARQEIYYRLKNMSYFENREKYETIIKIIIDLSNYSSKMDISLSSRYYNYEDLYFKLYNEESIIKDFYKKDADEYKKFLISILKGNTESSDYIDEFINMILSDPNYYESFPIPELELVEINIEKLNEYLNKIDELDSTAWKLFHNCQYIEIEKNTNRVIYKYPDKANGIIKNYLNKKGINYFLDSFVIEKNSQGYFISPNAIEVFESPNKILEYVNGFEQSSQIDEFKRFYDKASEGNFRSYIQYDFTEILIKKKL